MFVHRFCLFGKAPYIQTFYVVVSQGNMPGFNISSKLPSSDARPSPETCSIIDVMSNYIISVRSKVSYKNHYFIVCTI